VASSNRGPADAITECKVHSLAKIKSAKRLMAERLTPSSSAKASRRAVARVNDARAEGKQVLPRIARPGFGHPSMYIQTIDARFLDPAAAYGRRTTIERTRAQAAVEGRSPCDSGGSTIAKCNRQYVTVCANCWDRRGFFWISAPRIRLLWQARLSPSAACGPSTGMPRKRAVATNVMEFP